MGGGVLVRGGLLQLEEGIHLGRSRMPWGLFQLEEGMHLSRRGPNFSWKRVEVGSHFQHEQEGWGYWK